MEKRIYDTYVDLLHKELTVALGCTEPIAIAYAGAKLRDTLGAVPEHCTVYCSGNIVKNVMGVTVPNSDGAKGIATAAMLGAIGGDSSHVLAVLESVTEEHIAATRAALEAGCCECELVEGVENLYIRIEGSAGEDRALVEIRDYHSNITRIERNGEVTFGGAGCADSKSVDEGKELLNVKDILDFAECVDLNDVRDVLQRQLDYNRAIAEEGLKGGWGAEVGRTIMELGADSTMQRAKAYAAAASDARMNGCAMPVVINSGSGNQGITVSVPLLIYAEAYEIRAERMLRALAVANLISLHQKKYIGSLSAYCGAVSAATGSACGIAWMLGADYEEICGIVTNSINTSGGMVCDGAKSSCAAKIASAVDTALMSMQLSRRGRVFKSGEGLVKEDVEQTIASVGRMGREGMKSTDIEILKIMLGQ